MGKTPPPQPKKSSKAKEFLDLVTGANLPPCPGRTDLGVKCKRKQRPGYGGCGDRSCSSSHGF